MISFMLNIDVFVFMWYGTLSYVLSISVKSFIINVEPSRNNQQDATLY